MISVRRSLLLLVCHSRPPRPGPPRPTVRQVWFRLPQDEHLLAIGSAALGGDGSAEVHPYAPRPPALERVAAARSALAATGACPPPEQTRPASAPLFFRRLSAQDVCAPLISASAGPNKRSRHIRYEGPKTGIFLLLGTTALYLISVKTSISTHLML